MIRFDADIIRAALRPAWIALIVGATLLAALGALLVGLQQEPGETSTTFVFARRVGFLDRPLPLLDDHLNEIINSVEFEEVFPRIENRLLLRAERDYTLQIGQVENTQSVVAINVETDRVGEADRISRIIAEEMVAFVLAGQDLSIATEITDLETEIARLAEEQDRLLALSDGLPPDQAERRIEAELAGFVRGTVPSPGDDVEADLRTQLVELAPLSNEYGRTTRSLQTLQTRRAQTIADRHDITSGINSINDDWYRQITAPVQTSNVPIAVAMAFAAAVPAFLIASFLVLINVARRVRAAKAQYHKRMRNSETSAPSAAVNA